MAQLHHIAPPEPPTTASVVIVIVAVVVIVNVWTAAVSRLGAVGGGDGREPFEDDRHIRADGFALAAVEDGVGARRAHGHEVGEHEEDQHQLLATLWGDRER